MQRFRFEYRRSFLKGLCAASLAGAQALASPAFAQAEKWPSRPIQVLVGFPAGGLHDVIARNMTASMSQTLGTPIVVVPTPGAGGAIALQKLAQAQPDGYTVMYTPSPALMARPHQMGLPITYRDFTPIAVAAVAFPTISVKKDRPWSTFDDFRKEATAAPGKISYATAGVGGLPHLGMEQLASALGIKLLHVPYQGTPQAIAAVVSGEVDIVVGDLPNPNIRALAVMSPDRVQGMDMPALRELGAPSALYARFMFIGPAGLPAPIVTAFDDAIRKALAQPAVRKYFGENQIIARHEPAAAMAKWWPEDEKSYRDVIDRLGLAKKP